MAINNTKQVILSHPEEVVIYEIENKYNMPKIDGGKNKQFSQSRSMTMKRLWQDPSYRQNMSLAHLGYKYTEEAKKKMGQHRRGLHHTEDTKRKIARTRKLRGCPNPSFLGRRHTEESKKKMAHAHIGMKQSLETIQKRIIKTRGKKRSIETKLLQSRAISRAIKQLWNTAEYREKMFPNGVHVNKGRPFKGFSIETIQKIRAKRMLQILPVSNTTIEIKLFQLLDELDINYVKHVPVDDICQSDALIPSMKIAIFADGCFWHGCPVHFPKEVRKRVRDSYFNRRMKENGWTVLRFWEHDIHENSASVRSRLLEEVKKLS